MRTLLSTVVSGLIIACGTAPREGSYAVSFTKSADECDVLPDASDTEIWNITAHRDQGVTIVMGDDTDPKPQCTLLGDTMLCTQRFEEDGLAVDVEMTLIWEDTRFVGTIDLDWSCAGDDCGELEVPCGATLAAIGESL